MKRNAIALVMFATLLAVVVAIGQSSSSGPTEQDSGPSTASPSPPVGESARYVLPYYYSVAGHGGNNSVTVVNVYNQASVPCNVALEFQFATQTTDVCSITATIASNKSEIFCSRAVHDPVAPCHVVCSPGLTFNEGHAFVDSTNTISACANIAVDERVVFTDSTDVSVISSSRVSLVKFGGKNNGD